MPIGPEATPGSESASDITRRLDVLLAWILLVAALLAGLASSRTFVAVPLSMMSGKWNVLETVAIVAGLVATLRLRRQHVLGSTVRAMYAPLFLMAADVILLTFALVASYLHLDACSHLLAVGLSLYMSSQRPLKAMSCLIIGVYSAKLLGRDRVLNTLSASAVLSLVVGVLQALYKSGIWTRLLAPLKRFDLATGGLQATFHRPMGLSVGANAYGAFGVMCIAFALGTGTGAKRSTRATLLFSGTSIVVLSQSRGSMLAAGFVALAYVVRGLWTAESRSALKHDVLPAAVLTMIAAFLVFALPGSVSDNLTRRVSSAVNRASTQQSYDSGIDGRIEGWRTALSVIARAPLGTQLASKTILRAPLDNEFLERGVRGGIPNLIPMLAFLLWLSFGYRPRGAMGLGLLMAVGITGLGMSLPVAASDAFASFTMLVIGAFSEPSEPTSAPRFDTDENGLMTRPAERLTVAWQIGALVLVAALTLISLSHRPAVVRNALAYDARMLSTYGDLDRYRSILDARVRAHNSSASSSEAVDDALAKLLDTKPPINRKTQLLRLRTARDECVRASELAAAEQWGEAQVHLDNADAASVSFIEMR